MPRKKSHITITDQFCGAGGSSQGARQLSDELGGGIDVRLALNHWKLAIETHSRNFPATDHDCTDVSACDPRRYSSTDILITSPECTNHSIANGKKRVSSQLDMYDKGILDPSAERSRATMWDVPRFAEYHNYNLIIVENVVDARRWVMFDSWIHAMHSLGYSHKCVYLNSKHFWPTPQSRDRMYIVFWKSKNKAPMLDYTPFAWCDSCSKDVAAIQCWKNPSKRFGKYGQQYNYCCPTCARIVEPYYYAAFNCIDWSKKGTRIGERKKPLSPNTLQRIEYGLKKYAQEPFIVTSRYTSGIDHRVRPTTRAIGVQPGDVSHGVAMPFIIKEEHSQNLKNAVKISESLRTQTTRQSMALVIENRGTAHARSLTKAFCTMTTQNNIGLISNDAWHSFISYYYGTAQASHISDAIGTVTTKERHQLINYSDRIDDCYYRMLISDEVIRAMAFQHDYIVLGNEKERVRQAGNAVTPPVMKWLLGQGVRTLS